MKHFRFTLPRKEMYAKRYKGWEKKNKKLVTYVYNRIKNEGPLQSRDFEEPSKRGLWWDWKPAKDALEFLFHTGRLAARARKNFQKVYDMPERVLPDITNTSFPTDEELSEHYITKAITANGFASEKEMTYLRHHNRQATKSVLNKLAEGKKIVPLKIDVVDSETYYTTEKILKQLNHKKEKGQVHILSPFDNLVIQRKRLKTLFNFDYVIECYVPAPKRKFGYFCMPVIYGDKFIGRIDAKADRSEKILKVINMFWENEYKSKKSQKNLRPMIIEKLREMALFSGCGKISF
jgi:uncharacterized protein YcaQ